MSTGELKRLPWTVEEALNFFFLEFVFQCWQSVIRQPTVSPEVSMVLEGVSDMWLSLVLEAWLKPLYTWGTNWCRVYWLFIVMIMIIIIISSCSLQGCQIHQIKGYFSMITQCLLDHFGRLKYFFGVENVSVLHNGNWMFCAQYTIDFDDDAISIAVLWDLRFLVHYQLRKHFAQHFIKREGFHKTSTACEDGRTNRRWRCFRSKLVASERTSLVRDVHTMFCRHLWQK